MDTPYKRCPQEFDEEFEPSKGLIPDFLDIASEFYLMGCGLTKLAKRAYLRTCDNLRAPDRTTFREIASYALVGTAIIIGRAAIYPIEKGLETFATKTGEGIEKMGGIEKDSKAD